MLKINYIKTIILSVLRGSKDMKELKFKTKDKKKLNSYEVYFFFLEILNNYRTIMYLSKNDLEKYFENINICKDVLDFFLLEKKITFKMWRRILITILIKKNITIGKRLYSLKRDTHLHNFHSKHCSNLFCICKIFRLIYLHYIIHVREKMTSLTSIRWLQKGLYLECNIHYGNEVYSNSYLHHEYGRIFYKNNNIQSMVITLISSLLKDLKKSKDRDKLFNIIFRYQILSSDFYSKEINFKILIEYSENDIIKNIFIRFSDLSRVINYFNNSRYSELLNKIKSFFIHQNAKKITNDSDGYKALKEIYDKPGTLILSGIAGVGKTSFILKLLELQCGVLFVSNIKYHIRDICNRYCFTSYEENYDKIVNSCNWACTPNSIINFIKKHNLENKINIIVFDEINETLSLLMDPCCKLLTPKRREDILNFLTKLKIKVNKLIFLGAFINSYTLTFIKSIFRIKTYELSELIHSVSPKLPKVFVKSNQINGIKALIRNLERNCYSALYLVICDSIRTVQLIKKYLEQQCEVDEKRILTIAKHMIKKSASLASKDINDAIEKIGYRIILATSKIGFGLSIVKNSAIGIKKLYVHMFIKPEFWPGSTIYQCLSRGREANCIYLSIDVNNIEKTTYDRKLYYDKSYIDYNEKVTFLNQNWCVNYNITYIMFILYKLIGVDTGMKITTVNANVKYKNNAINSLDKYIDSKKIINKNKREAIKSFELNDGIIACINFCKLISDHKMLKILEKMKINRHFINYVLTIEECVSICQFISEYDLFHYIEKKYHIRLCKDLDKKEFSKYNAFIIVRNFLNMFLKLNPISENIRLIKNQSVRYLTEHKNVYRLKGSFIYGFIYLLDYFLEFIQVNNNLVEIEIENAKKYYESEFLDVIKFLEQNKNGFKI